MESVEVKVARLEERIEDMGDQLTSIGKDVRDMRDTLTRQRGFFTGASLSVSAVWAAGIALWNLVRST